MLEDALVSVALAVNALALGILLWGIVCRFRVEQRLVVVVGITVLLSGVLGFVGARVVSGSWTIWIPSLGSLVIAAILLYVVRHYWVPTAERVASEQVLERVHDGVLMLRTDYTVLECNQRGMDMLGLTQESVLNRRIEDVMSASVLTRQIGREVWSMVQHGASVAEETRYVEGDKEQILVHELSPVHDVRYGACGYIWIIRDVTCERLADTTDSPQDADLLQELDDLRTLSQVQEQVIETMQMLAAPAVPVVQGIVVMPLSGQIDSERAKRIMDNLLEAITDHQARIAIIDITGVPVVDTAVAQYLIQTSRAALLMGCRSILVGIRPEIAQVIVELGIHMEGLDTFSDLQGGFEHALHMMGMELNKLMPVRQELVE